MTKKVLLGARVPPELKELVDADRRTNQEIVEAALWREFGGKRKGALQRRVDEKKRRISQIESEKNERERELEEAEQELNALETKLEKVETNEERTKREALRLVENTPRDTDMAKVQKAAEQLGATPSDVVKMMEEKGIGEEPL